MEFEPDAMVAQIAMEYAADIVDLARTDAGVKLDFSVDSVREVETIAGRLATAKSTCASACGPGTPTRSARSSSGPSGSTSRRPCACRGAAIHGWVSDGEGSRVYGLRLPDDSLCVPVARARDRLAHGDVADLVAYVAGLREPLTYDRQTPEPPHRGDPSPVPAQPSLATPYRTHTCGALRADDAGMTAKLAGWVHRRRDYGKLIFIDLRDRHGITQVVIDAGRRPRGARDGEPAPVRVRRRVRGRGRAPPARDREREARDRRRGAPGAVRPDPQRGEDAAVLRERPRRPDRREPAPQVPLPRHPARADAAPAASCAASSSRRSARSTTPTASSRSRRPT